MLSKVVIFFIRIYQVVISPYFSNCCRFRPTCSEYAIESIQKHGLIYGIISAIKRIFRCNPLGGSGFDPVKQNKHFIRDNYERNK
jgi:putative membrane protein insertion efficiency factor